MSSLLERVNLGVQIKSEFLFVAFLSKSMRVRVLLLNMVRSDRATRLTGHYLPELGPGAVPAEEAEQHQQQHQRGGPEHGQRGGEGGQLAGPGRGRGRGAGQHPHPGSSVGEGRVWIQGVQVASRWPPGAGLTFVEDHADVGAGLLLPRLPDGEAVLVTAVRQHEPIGHLHAGPGLHPLAGCT